MPVDPFTFDHPSSLLGRAALSPLRPLLSKALGLSEFRRLHAAIQDGGDEAYMERVLKVLDITADDGGTLDALPPTGPLIVAANHPHGFVDGLTLASLVRKVRPDARLVVNWLLGRIPQLQEQCFFVDPFRGPRAAARSLAGLRDAHLWLRRGGALILFPAGSVSHVRAGSALPVDEPWTADLGRLASRNGAAIVPAFIPGRNSRAFYAAGRVHPLLRTALLPRELLRTRGTRIAVSFGRPISTTALGASEVTARARQAVDGMASAKAAAIERAPADRIAEEISALPPSARLTGGGDFDVYAASSELIPAALAEIGRLRAEAYRAAGEGSGTDVDLDPFDNHYLHLFSWDRRHSRIAGAYRIGRVDDIMASHGVNGLYTRTLFDYGPDFISRMPPALELGRSFVTLDYQKHHQSLLLLWKGIGHFVARHPHYRLLFGPVSISARYCDASHDLLSTFLAQNHLDRALASMVTPKHPRPSAPPSGRVSRVPGSAADADRLIASLEPDGKGMPVLLRQYLRLNARAIAFSVDPDFGGVLDALMAVDLLAVDRALLKRYVGEELDGYLRSHLPAQTTAA